MSDKMSRSLNLKYKNIVQVDNANLKEDNNNNNNNNNNNSNNNNNNNNNKNNNNNTAAEQPLTIDERLERRPEKTLGKKSRKSG